MGCNFVVEPKVGVANHMNRFVAGDRGAKQPRRSENVGLRAPAFDCPVILFQNIIEIPRSSSTSRYEREKRKYHPTANRMTSGSNCRHLNKPQTEEAWNATSPAAPGRFPRIGIAGS